MILLDFQQTLIANLMMQLKKFDELDEDVIRHMVLNSIRFYVKTFGKEYGKLIICCDSRNSWRKDVFPYYKAKRRLDQEASPLNWTLIFESLNKIREELKTYFPYPVIEIDKAEGDDIIATLATWDFDKDNPFGSDKILIISSDKDFQQLQTQAIKQYSPLLKKFIATESPKKFLREHIIKGDAVDGIPNILSSDETFVAGDRQKPIFKTSLEQWISQEPEAFCTTESMLRGYKRNEQLIDFKYIPQSVTNDIVEAYIIQLAREKPTKMRMMNYFIKFRLKTLMEVLDEF